MISEPDAKKSDIWQKMMPSLIIWGIFLLAYVPVFVRLWDRWFSRDSYYTHGILVPFVSGYLIWQERKELEKLPYVPSPWGMALFLLGIAIYLFSSLFRINFSAGFSMLIIFLGLVLHLYGKKVVSKIIFPIFFLVFMIPLPSESIVTISFKMKLFAADIAAKILNQIGLLCIREGSIIKMQNTYVVVDDVCSGLRSLISLTALGSIFAYWLKGPLYKRIFLFLFTIPIAVVTNVCRVILLSCISEIWGSQYATGFTHDALGFLVFILAFMMLYFLSKLIEDSNAKTT